MASAGRACSGGQQAQGRSRQCPVGAEGAHFGQAIQLVSALVAADLAEQIGQAPIQPGPRRLLCMASPSGTTVSGREPTREQFGGSLHE